MVEHIKIGDVSPRVQYVGNGAVQEFSYSFPIFEQGDLQVYLDEDLQASGYDVTGAGDSNGGTVSFAVAPADDVIVTLSRLVPEARTTDFQEGGAFRAKVINEELDRIVCMVQQVRSDVDRTMSRPVTSASTASLDLPDPAAGCALKWNAEGDALENSSFDPDTLASAANVASSAAANAATSEVNAKASEVAAGNDAASVAAALSTMPKEDSVNVSVDATVSADANGRLYHLMTSSSAVTLTVPVSDDAATGDVDAPFVFFVQRSGAEAANVTAAAPVTINGSTAPFAIADGSSAKFILDESVDPHNWKVISYGAAVGDATPVGSIDAFAMSAMPSGYLKCNGAAVSRDIYSDLFAAIGTTYGAGDNVTTFNIPSKEDITAVDETVIKEFTSNAQPAGTGTFAWAHGFGVVPDVFKIYMRCVSPRLGFEVGDVIEVPYTISGAHYGAVPHADATNITATFNAMPTVVGSVATDVAQAANWEFFAYAAVYGTEAKTPNISYGIKAFNNAVLPANVDLETLASYNNVRVGAVATFAQDTAPTGWLEISDAPTTVSRTTYSALYSEIGDKYGAGDNSTTFNLPEQADIYPDFYKEGAAISGAEGAPLGNMTSGGGLSALFDGSNSTTANAGWQTSEQQGFAGKDFGSVKRIWSAIVVPDSTYGFLTNESSPPTPVVTVQIRGSNAAPSSQADGVLLGSHSSEDSTATVNIQCDASLGAYRYVWAAFESSNSATLTTTSEITFVEAKEVSLPTLTCIKAYDVVQEAAGPTTQDLVTAVEGSRLRVGARMLFESDPGAGWLVEDGSVYNIATYPDLGALLGNKYGGNGVTTFGVKNSIVTTQVPQDEGTVFGDMTNDGLATLFDGNVDTSTYKPGFTSDGYAGKHYESAKKIISVALTSKGYGSYGFVTNESETVTLTVDVYGSNTLPTSQTDGTVIGTYTGPDVIPGLEIACDSMTAYQYVWCAFSTNEASTLVSVAEIVFTEVSESTYIKAYDVINETAGVATADIMTEVNLLKARGGVIQTVHVQDGAGASFASAVIPVDNTPPQNSEGEECLSAAITPTSATSRLRVEATVYVTNPVVAYVTAALFKDADVDAIAVGSVRSSDSNQVTPISFVKYLTAGTTSQMTFKVRIGSNTGTTRFNHTDFGDIFAGLLASTLTVTEFAQ